MGRYKRTRSEKNIRKDESTNEWIVYKKFKHLKQPHTYARFNTFREAKKYRNRLDKKDLWITELPEDKKVKVLKSGKNYMTTKNGYCYIYKTRNYMQYFYGRYASKADAEKVIRYLILNDWDWDKVPEEIKQLRIPSRESARRYEYSDENDDLLVAVKRTVHGKNHHFGIYPNKETADKVIEWLEENDWTSDLPEWITDLQCKKGTPKYYSKQDGRYVVNKNINRQTIFFGAYSNKEDAENAVEQLKKHNWDYQWFLENKNMLNCNKRYNPADKVKKDG